MAARRRFATSGLADFATWSDDSVATRLTELESMLAACAVERVQEDDSVSPSEAVDSDALARQIADNNRQLASHLAVARLTIEDTKGDSGDWLRSVASADRAQDSLHRVKCERERLGAEAVELRDQLLAYLYSHGVRPTELLDTAAAISRRLERLPGST